MSASDAETTASMIGRRHGETSEGVPSPCRMRRAMDAAPRWNGAPSLATFERATRGRIVTITPPTKTTHACPGGCKRQVEYGRLACSGDWRRLTKAEPILAAAIRTAWHHRNRSNEARRAHREIVGQAIAWFKLNPAPAGMHKRNVSGQRADSVIIDEWR